MALIDRYIFRIAGLAFLTALVGLTGVIWVTQALRDFNMFTNEGQSVLTFLKLIALLLPAMIGLIAPVALFIAIIQTLQRLNADNELVVMQAAGMSHFRVMRPILTLAILVTIGASIVSLWAAPQSYRNWRDLIASARAQFVSQIVREGRFNTIDNGIVFHYRERVGDALLGLFIQDRRDPELTLVYVAESGQIIESPSGTFLVLLDGSVQRETARNLDASIIGFKRYALDLALLSPNAGDVSYRPRERTTLDLYSTATSGRMTKDERGPILSELTERISTPLYGIAFAFIALAAFAKPKSTRQRKWIALTSAIAIALLGRLAGFALAILIQQRPEFYWTALVCPLALAALAFFALVIPRPRLTFLRMRPAT